MRILHCLRAPVGGLFRHVLDLAGAQAALGHDVGLIADSTATDALTVERLAAIAPALSLGIARVAMHRLPAISDLAACRAVAAHARAVSADVLHGHGAKGGAFARLAGQSLNSAGRSTATFYTPHGGSLNYKPGSLQSRLFLGIERAVERWTDGLIFESAYAARIYAERVGTGRVPYRVIPNGLQPADFIPHTPHPDAADVLFIGELRTIKGVDVLLRALAAANQRRPSPLRAMIVGSGPDAAALNQLSADLGLAGSVAFPGAMPAPRAFPQGRILVVPSRKESFPYVVLEAAAAAMPLVSTNVGGIPEIVAGTDTGLIPADDVAALAAAILDAVAHPALAQARADRLKTAVAARFTVQQMTCDILAFYAEAMALRSPGQPGVAAATAA
jgi:glycosyltransferase involved in cell wall biosynthesis